ncbi:glutamate 5-kinase [Phycisphaera mikurensis]|uniref:Glutamate 5-kinase n=1 Tax=Phycisphaera mikurensis (strain NBRC 102666 / KCTC 22515 / FYK2301M01) TaxID=1142394 RepID=I0IEG6_PHYMF|nr:glutamate 5-kinase [Phycisphaera mikurensis]MBB6441453.1 glutamate 5-kinase [Phycisphaera mikurensis]BAM03654.1 glutamate 5-kinase [Phycisphaera mikurensis NBRC 102666]
MPRTALTNAREIVVKIGSQLLATARRPRGGGEPRLAVDTRFIGAIARQVAGLHADGRRVTLVSSGAIAAGCAELGRADRPTDVADAQAVAAVGQRRLMTHWHDAFARVGLGVGQVLLTRTDFDDRLRFLNLHNCVTRLQAMDCVPIANENDTVAVEELRFGDNDLLAALLSNAVHADALVILSGVAGLLDGGGAVIPEVSDLLAASAQVRADRSGWGSGGMGTKIDAARIVVGAGATCVIAGGRQRDVVARVLAGEAEDAGTLFVPAARRLDARRRWIGLTARPAGGVTVDAGAARALAGGGASLLASGITATTGAFDRGDVLLVRDAAGRELARGLSNYAAAEVRLLQGRQSGDFARILGRPAYSAVIHRDSLVLTG